MRSTLLKLAKRAMLVFAVSCSLSTSGSLAAQDAPFADHEIHFFETHIRPLLVEHCLECHGDNEQKLRGGLRLTSRQEMMTGGDSGPAVVPGDAAASLLMEAIAYDGLEMPPQGKLPAEQIELFRKWIEMGVPDPRTPGTTQPVAEIDIELGKRFWSFRPLQKIEVADVAKSDEWVRSEIDAFIWQRLDQAGLEPVADANRETLVRRIYLALIGLPPTEAQITSFLHSTGSLEDDLAKLVDELLASPHFGERWGRHWLDVARFAESSGGGRSLMFPHAWRFRDYVIDAYNTDKPFDQFIKEQIAGDLLPFETNEQRTEHLVATGFLALGPTNYEQQDKELLRMEVVDEQVDTIGRAFLALTLGCARCHDHKFDPIPTRDYYAMAGIFQSTVSLVDGNVSSYVTRSLASEAELQEQASYKRQVDELTQQLNIAKTTLAKLGGGAPVGAAKSVSISSLSGRVIDNQQAEKTGIWTDSTYEPRFIGDGYIHDNGQPKGANAAVFSPVFDVGGHYEVRMSYTSGGNRASNVPVTIDHQDGIAKVIVNQSQEPNIDRLFVSLGTYRFEANSLAAVTISNIDTDGVVIVDAVQFLPVNENGDPLTAGEASSGGQEKSEAGPDTDNANPPGITTDTESPQLIAAKKQVEELERQLKELKQNRPPPVSVAMSVEESKQPADGHLHIRGEVRNLGEVVPRGFLQVLDYQATSPAIGENSSGRLELANWIANEDHPLTARVYVNRVWRHLFGRGLVETTDNFGAMGREPTHPELLDYLATRFVQNDWSTKQLIREIVLTHTFRLSSTYDAGRASIDPENRLLWRANRRRVDAEVLRDSLLAVSGELDLQAGGLTIRKLTEYDLGYEFDTLRRSVYVPAFRNSMLDLFEVFDLANPNLVVGHRNTSTLATQALYLMNSPFVIEQSRRAAAKLLRETPGGNVEQRLHRVYLQTIGRAPTATEKQLALAYLQQFDLRDRDQPSDVGAEEEHAAWASLYHALFASLDFRYIH